MEMHENFNRFFAETMHNGGHEPEASGEGSRPEETSYENSVKLSNKETIFLWGQEKSHCFMVTVPEDCLDNKAILIKNLELLKEFMQKVMINGK